jgi:hypothetical protein
MFNWEKAPINKDEFFEKTTVFEEVPLSLPCRNPREMVRDVLKINPKSPNHPENVGAAHRSAERSMV